MAIKKQKKGVDKKKHRKIRFGASGEQCGKRLISGKQMLDAREALGKSPPSWSERTAKMAWLGRGRWGVTIDIRDVKGAGGDRAKQSPFWRRRFINKFVHFSCFARASKQGCGCPAFGGAGADLSLIYWVRFPEVAPKWFRILSKRNRHFLNQEGAMKKISLVFGNEIRGQVFNLDKGRGNMLKEAYGQATQNRVW